MAVDAQKTKQSKSKFIPDHIEMVRKPEKQKIKFTPETVQEDEALLEKLPKPTGYRIMILPFSQKQMTKGGIVLADSYLEKERLGTNVGFVVSLGPDAWIIFGRYAGARIKIEGGDLRLLNDDEVLAVVDNPENVQ